MSLQEFLRSSIFKKIYNTLSSRLGETLFLLNEEGALIWCMRDCRWLHRPLFEEACKKRLLSLFLKAKKERRPALAECPIGMHLFLVPIYSDSTLFGAFGGCQIVDPKKNYLFYKESMQACGADAEGVLHRLYEGLYISEDIILQELEFASTLLHLAMECFKKRPPKEVGKDLFVKLFLLCQRKGIEEAFFKKVVELTAKLMRVRICSLLLEQGGMLKIVAAKGVDPRIIKTCSLSATEGLVGHVMKEGKALLVKDIEKDERFAKVSARRYYTKSLLMCPIKVKGVCKGVMSVNNKENRESFNEKDLCTLCTIAALISETIQKDEEQREVLLLREHLEKERERAKEYIKEVNALKDRVREFQELQKDVKELVHRPKESSIEDYLSKLESVATKLSGFDAISKMQQQLEDLHTTYKEHMDTLSITEEKERLRELHRARAEAEEFALLYKVASSITGLSDPKEIVERALEESKDFFHPCAASYLLLFRGRVSAKLLLHYPLSEEGVKQIKGEMRERSLKILRRKKALSIDLEKDEFAQVLGKEERVQDILCCPLEREKKSFGFMSVYSVEEEAFSPLHKKVFSIISTLVSLSLERAALFAETKEGAEKDELTGAYNFRLLRKILERELTRAKRYSRPLSLIMLDFDHLKEFNDRFGHHQGNRLIRSVAVAIKRRTRAQDYVARYGGDEFVVVLPETSLEEAATVAERIRSSIHSLRIKRIPCTISASIGVVGAPPLEPKDADNFLKFADKALYQAKSEGRNTVFVQRS